MSAAAEYRDLIAAMDAETRAALVEFAQDHGQGWRGALRALWTYGRDTGALRRVRNTLGPSGINHFKVQP